MYIGLLLLFCDSRAEERSVSVCLSLYYYYLRIFVPDEFLTRFVFFSFFLSLQFFAFASAFAFDKKKVCHLTQKRKKKEHTLDTLDTHTHNNNNNNTL